MRDAGTVIQLRPSSLRLSWHWQRNSPFPSLWTPVGTEEGCGRTFGSLLEAAARDGLTDEEADMEMLLEIYCLLLLLSLVNAGQTASAYYTVMIRELSLMVAVVCRLMEAFRPPRRLSHGLLERVKSGSGAAKSWVLGLGWPGGAGPEGQSALFGLRATKEQPPFGSAIGRCNLEFSSVRCLSRRCLQVSSPPKQPITLACRPRWFLLALEMLLRLLPYCDSMLPTAPLAATVRTPTNVHLKRPWLRTRVLWACGRHLQAYLRCWSHLFFLLMVSTTTVMCTG